MSEQGRTTLKPFGKRDKAANKVIQKTLRFSFKLSEPNEESCPVFDYVSVIKSEERKIIKKQKEDKSKKTNGLLEPFKDDDDEDVRRIAKKFEEKYGDKKGKIKSYSELGAGYDETDSFIDNTEAHDEELEEDLVTPHGGYYINCGRLELKRVHVSDHSDADDIGKSKHKVLQVIEEDEDEKTEEAEISNQNGDIKSEDGSCDDKKSKLSEDEEMESKNTEPCRSNVEEPVKKGKKRLIVSDAETGAVKSKKPKSVKTLLEEKRAEETTSAEESKKHVEESKKQPATVTSISEAIESVINAGNIDENSNCSNASNPGSEASSSSADNCEDKAGQSAEVSPPPLPKDLLPELLKLVEQVKQTALVTENTRKTFNPKIDDCLVRIERRSKDLSTSNRNLLFGHLASYLPCTKDTLMRRSKKLLIQKEEKKVDILIYKLKSAIDATMPSLLESYRKACQRIEEEKSLSVPSLNGSSAGQNHSKGGDSPKLPKRKFPWTDETREYLREIVRLKNRCYKTLKPRKYTNEEYIRSFLQSKVWILWPQGWMKISILLGESSLSPLSGKSKHSRHSDPSRLSTSAGYPPVSLDSTAESVRESPITSASTGSPHHQPKSPHVPKTEADRSKTTITDTFTSPVSEPQSQNLRRSPTNSATQETYLLARTNESTNCSDFNTTLSDILKQDSSVLMNGASLPLISVNNSLKNIPSNNKTEKLLNSSNFNASSVSGTSGVIQSFAVASNERTMMRASDAVSLSANGLSDRNCAYLSSSNRKEPQSLVVEGSERRMSDETTTATDILSQIISESLLAPSQPPSTNPIPSLFNNKVVKDEKSSSKRNHDMLYEHVMQDLKELNHISSRGPSYTQHDNKNSYKNSWTHSSSQSQNHMKRSSHSPFQNEFMKHLTSSQQVPSPATPTSTSPYSSHSISPFENSQFVTEVNHHITFNSSPHRTVQNMSHAGTPPTNKVSMINQACAVNSVPNTGHPHSYMPQMDYGADNQHMMGLPPNFQYGLNNWHYPGGESQSHQ